MFFILLKILMECFLKYIFYKIIRKDIVIVKNFYDYCFMYSCYFFFKYSLLFLIYLINEVLDCYLFFCIMLGINNGDLL